MRTPRSALLFLSVGLVLGLGLVTCSKPTPSQKDASNEANFIVQNSPRFAPQPAFASASEGDSGARTIADVAEKVVPSVVNISATRVVERRRSPFMNDPFFREFFGRPHGIPKKRRQRSLGSGVIVSKDGVILTNNHVVKQADEVEITLSDGRELEAEIVGSDPRSDVAVLEVKGEVQDLEPISLGDSAGLRLGEVVLAVGNPFGVGQTVTMGIVSATGRSQVGLTDYEDFIQTDAAINPGNSGGALVNMNGELVGINTAILSRTGGYQGIGFAIPTNMAKPIMESLIEDGKVERGWLGVMIQDLDRDLAEGLGIEKVQQGVLISDVTEGSPADEAGLERGDVVFSANGERVKSIGRFRNLIASAGPGAEVELGVLRDGERKSIKVELGSLAESPSAESEAVTEEGALSGLKVVALSSQTRAQYEIPKRIENGVVVAGVQPGSAAQSAGLREGDVILEINKVRVKSIAQFSKLHRQAGDRVLLLVYRDGATLYMSLRR